MHILLSNDDGYDAPGLHAFATALRKLGRVTIAAPELPKSGASSSLTLNHPVRAHKMARDEWAVSGNPADAVKIALHELLPKRPDLVVSGINNGLNTGTNVIYSGTVAAALEGAMYGITSFAVSRHVAKNDEFRAQARMATTVIRRLAKRYPRTAAVFNINLPPNKPKGTLVTATEQTPYDDRYDRRRDPRGNDYFWLHGTPPRKLKLNGRATDDWAVANGYVAVTPLRRDLTDTKLLGDLSRHMPARP